MSHILQYSTLHLFEQKSRFVSRASPKQKVILAARRHTSARRRRRKFSILHTPYSNTPILHTPILQYSNTPILQYSILQYSHAASRGQYSILHEVPGSRILQYSNTPILRGVLYSMRGVQISPLPPPPSSLPRRPRRPTATTSAVIALGHGLLGGRAGVHALVDAATRRASLPSRLAVPLPPLPPSAPARRQGAARAIGQGVASKGYRHGQARHDEPRAERGLSAVSSGAALNSFGKPGSNLPLTVRPGAERRRCN